MLTKFITDIFNLYMDNITYPAIFFLMTLESTFIPIPSELVVPPAAWKAAQSQMNVYLVITVSTAGCILGALINYFIAKFLGRKIIYSFVDSRAARIFLVNRKSLEKSEKFFITYGRSSTLIGRLVPGVRHLISIPAGLALMNIKDFILYTAIGSAIWNSILAVLGYLLYTKKELMKNIYSSISILFLLVFIVFVIYVSHKFITRNRNNGNRPL